MFLRLLHLPTLHDVRHEEMNLLLRSLVGMRDTATLKLLRKERDAHILAVYHIVPHSIIDYGMTAGIPAREEEILSEGLTLVFCEGLSSADGS